MQALLRTIANNFDDLLHLRASREEIERRFRDNEIEKGYNEMAMELKGGLEEMKREFLERFENIRMGLKLMRTWEGMDIVAEVCWRCTKEMPADGRTMGQIRRRNKQLKGWLECEVAWDL